LVKTKGEERGRSAGHLWRAGEGADSTDKGTSNKESKKKKEESKKDEEKSGRATFLETRSKTSRVKARQPKRFGGPNKQR